MALGRSRGDGDDANIFRSKPGPVSNLSNVKTIASDSTAHHALALKTDGTVKSSGANVTGQLGDGTSENYSDSPVAVKNLLGVRNMDGGATSSPWRPPSNPLTDAPLPATEHGERPEGRNRRGRCPARKETNSTSPRTRPSPRGR